MQVAHANKQNSTLPFNYMHCFDGTCNHGGDIAVDKGCQDMRWFSMTDKGADFKKLGSGIKVNTSLANTTHVFFVVGLRIDFRSIVIRWWKSQF